ncbi:vitellogenin-like [Osmia bicornis bicornis]|uniref:vitellogenin-like n=1 Tax=Osmia bicornis bicornis TaxID=1437191 RepID=UPI0010F6FFE0|nr:vitellogenin-like [Osmia bicornis bicornis]
MLAIILPFFLAAHVPVDQPSESSNWQQYGPESTYDVLVNMSLSNIVHQKDNFCSMIGAELKCRLKGSDTLGCRFANGKIVRPDPEDARCSNAKNFVPINDRFVDEQPFEVRFNSRGIENLVVSRNIARWRLDMIRAIIGQLNVGFELEKGRQRFVTMENSSIGYCEVEIKMSRTGYSREDTADDRRRFQIVFEPERADMVPLDRAVVRIEKIRRPKNCPNRKIYFFGNQQDFSYGYKNIFMDMTTSTSHIRISENEMHSYTESTGIMRTLNKPRTMHMHQKISITLKSIDPARGALPEILDPASTSLYAYTNLDRIPEEE